MTVSKHKELELLSALIKERNSIEEKIAKIIGRPAERGHIGEFVAAEIFDIELHESATHKGSDGIFRRGSLAGRTVNIKSYGKRESILDMKRESPPDFYLVLTGPKTAAASSRGATRPWVISSVFLFDHHELVSRLKVKIGTATSVKRHFWDEAEIYPSPRNEDFIPTLEQHLMLEMFGD